MAEICESLECANLIYEIIVEATEAGTGKRETRLFDGGDLGEVVKQVKRYVEAMPKGHNLSIKGRVKVTNTFALSTELIECLLERPVKPELAAIARPQVIVQERIYVPSLSENVLLNPKEVAELIGVANQTLAYWRTQGSGPKFVIVGARSIRYWRDDLMKWIEEGKRESTFQY